MNSQRLFALLKAKFGIMVTLGVLFAAISFVGLLFFEKPFQSSMDFLIVQTNGQTLDYYTQFKSSEYLGKVLSGAVYSERFINAVVETGKVSAAFLPANKKDRLKAWSKTVSVKNNLELGIISVTVKSARERDAARIIDGAALVLTEQNSLFRGGDEKSVDIRILSGPILEHTPTTSEIYKVILGGFFAGFFLTGCILLVRAEIRSKRIALKKELGAFQSKPAFEFTD